MYKSQFRKMDPYGFVVQGLSDIPVFARWPLPVWFCLLNILLHMDSHAFDQSLQGHSLCLIY